MNLRLQILVEEHPYTANDDQGARQTYLIRPIHQVMAGRIAPNAKVRDVV